MKKTTIKNFSTELRSFAESLTASIEEVADKIAQVEAIISGGDDEVEATEEDDYVEEPVEDEDEVVESTESEAEDDEVVEDDSDVEAETETFSEKTTKSDKDRYASVKDFLSMSI